MKCKAHLCTYKHGIVQLCFETESLKTITEDGDKAVDKWEGENDDISYRESYEDENGNFS